MSEQLRRCANCGKQAPETDTAHTLISASHGWRFTARTLPEGGVRREWCCPTCWAERKKKRSSRPPSAR